MAFLDSLFDPSNYGGSQSGLLDFLRSPQWQYQTPDAPQRIQVGPQQADPIAVGGYQMPRIGAAATFDPAQVNLAGNSAPVEGQLPPAVANAQAGPSPQSPQEQPQQLPPALGGNQIGGNFGAGLQNFINTPGGLLQKTLGAGIGASTGQRTDPAGMQQQNLKAQYDSLLPILGPQKALLAVMNPEAGKTLLTEALTNKEKYTQTGEDAFGNKQYGFVNEREQTINGQPINAGSQGATSSFLAPGVKQVDSSLQGPEYLNQFSPEIQASVKDYIAGRSMPTGNARKGFTQAVKMIAQKYGSDIGEPADDATFAAKKKMRTDLSSSSPNSTGGILANGASAFSHLADFSDKAAAHPNYSGPNIWGGDTIGQYANSITNSTPANAAHVSGMNDNLLKYGQEGTKFYTGTGGGEAERMNALKNFDASTSSPLKQAEFLQTEKQLMLDRFKTKENQVSEQLGQEYLDKHPVIPQSVNDAVARIDANIAKLKGETSTSQASAKPQTVIQNGHTYNLQPDGSYK